MKNLAENRQWRVIQWGEIATLEYGKGLRGYDEPQGLYRVFGTNGPIGWHNECLSEGATIIIGRKGAYRGVHYSSEPCFIIDTAFYLKQHEIFDMRWAYYELLTHDINGMDSGSAIPSTSRSAFYLLPVKVPPINEQYAIAHILGTLDDKIELNRKMNTTLEEMARAIFKSWFVDFEPVRAKMDGRWQHGQSLPGLPASLFDLCPDKLVGSELGVIPEGWVLKRYIDTIVIFGGGTPNTSIAEYWNGDIPWFSVVDAPTNSDIWVIDTAKKISVKGLTNSSTKILPTGTTIISARGTVGKVALVARPMAMNQSCYAFRSKIGDKGFYTYFCTRDLVARLQQRAHGSVFDTITRDTIASVLSISPPDNFVKSFDDYIEPFILKIRENLFHSCTLAALRDTLLPKLISGQIRVRDAERFLKQRGL